MTTFEWAMLSVTVAGFLVTCGGVLAGCVWAVANIKADVTLKLEAFQERMTDDLDKVAAGAAKALQDHIQRDDEVQERQDHTFGELGSSLRRAIETLANTVREHEIWNRDHYAQKPDVEKSIDGLRSDIKAIGAEIKNDIRALSAKVDSKN